MVGEVLDVSLYTYGNDKMTFLQHSSSPIKLHFYLRCIADCIDSETPEDTVESYNSILTETENYLKQIIETLYENKSTDNINEFQDAFTYIVSRLDIEDVSKAKEIILLTAEDVSKIRSKKKRALFSISQSTKALFAKLSLTDKEPKNVFAFGV